MASLGVLGSIGLQTTSLWIWDLRIRCLDIRQISSFVLCPGTRWRPWPIRRISDAPLPCKAVANPNHLCMQGSCTRIDAVTLRCVFMLPLWTFGWDVIPWWLVTLTWCEHSGEHFICSDSDADRNACNYSVGSRYAFLGAVDRAALSANVVLAVCLFWFHIKDSLVLWTYYHYHVIPLPQKAALTRAEHLCCYWGMGVFIQE